MRGIANARRSVRALQLVKGQRRTERMEITHAPSPETGELRQIVSPQRLTEILRASGDTLDRPDWFGPNDEWEVED